MLKRFLFALALLAPAPAFAAPSLVVRMIQDGTGTHTQNFCDMSGIGTGPFQPIGATDTSCNGLVSSGGFNTDVTSAPTVNNNTAYAVSGSVGGLQTIPVFRTTANPSGILNYISYMSKAGTTGAVTVYAYDKTPAGVGSYNCANNSAFVDDPGVIGSRIPGFPVVLTPAVSQGSTQSIASSPVTMSVKNQDGTPTANLYFCVVANAIFTTTTNTDVLFKVSISQD